MTSSTDRYTIISADTHAGANHETYREYLDPSFHEDFDAWRGKYKNPWKDLRDTDLRIRNWDDDRRDADMLAEGVVGEVIFPNTVPPFYPGFVLFAGPPRPDQYEWVPVFGGVMKLLRALSGRRVISACACLVFAVDGPSLVFALPPGCTTS